METKYVKVPFNLEQAKKITNGEIEGRIVTRDGRSARVACWDLKAINKSYSILALIDNGNEEVTWTYSNNGRSNTELECKHDLMLEIPEYITFKDGDVIAYDDRDAIVILKGEPKVDDSNIVGFRFYVNMFGGDLGFYSDRVLACVNSARKATPEEIEKLKKRLEKDDRQEAKEYLKRFFGIEQKSECEFKPFDKVLVRESDDDIWDADIFSRQGQYGSYICIGGLKEYCIPYNEQTAHLLGTTEDWEE